LGSIDDFFDRYLQKKAFVSSSKVPDHIYKNAEYTCGKVIYTAEIDTLCFLPAHYQKVTMSMSLGRQAVLANTSSLDRYYKDFNDLPF
jgi:hypothetical protein